MKTLTLIRAGTAALALAIAAPAAMTFVAPAEAHDTKAMMNAMSTSDLRVTLNKLLGEHVTLAASATGAALQGRQDEFKAAAAALDANSWDIAGAIGLVYGKDAQEAFLPLWQKHIGFVVDYTMASAKKDMAGKEKAVADLLAYAEDFGAFLNAANKGLPKEAVAELVRGHITSLAPVIDAQASGDYTASYAAERQAYAHMQHIADALADAIAKQFPKKFSS